MCGLTGFLSATPASFPAGAADVLRRMTDLIAHRGPDDAGYWLDAGVGVALGHRRLAIVDLSPQGHQPMASVSGRYQLVFNGEIYNHAALRAELQAAGKVPVWRGHSDTEVLLAGVEAWGLTATLQRAVGMFAIALWDLERQELSLARDRLGEKPLYYGWAGDGLLFASELKSLRAWPGFPAEVDRDALTQLLRFNYIPAPHTIYCGIHKLPPGCLLTVAAGDRAARALPAPQPYWSLADRLTQIEPFRGSDAEATDRLQGLLGEALSLQKMADVPLGAFLSGGIDSSTVVALLQAQASRPVQTFTIGFHEAGYNEAEYAKAVAQHLGTEHYELYVTPADALALVPQLPTLYDEPFADASQLPTYLVCALARQRVTVALSGDGGDELFGGYLRYTQGSGLRLLFGPLPVPLRRLLAGLLGSLPVTAWDTLYRLGEPLLPRGVRQTDPGNKLHALADVLRHYAGNGNAADDLYRQLVSLWKEPARLVLGASEPPLLTAGGSFAATPATLADIPAMQYQDCLTYLPDDILVKVDRAAMGVSLETRVPLLDHRLVEFAWSLPAHMQRRIGQGKWLLRQVLYRHVPRELIERPKMGFGVPIDHWLRHELRDWAEALLDESRLRREGYFYPQPIRRRWQEHLDGQRNWQYPLWGVLMFQSWLEAQQEAPRPFIPLHSA